MRIVMFVVTIISIMMMQVAHAQAEEESEPAYAVLFPWFAETMGLVVFYLLTRCRYLEALPFTAIMFILGTSMGVRATRLGHSDQLTKSILTWDVIDR